MKIIKDSLENEIKTKTDDFSKVMLETFEVKKTLEEEIKNLTNTQSDVNKRLANMNDLVMEKEKLAQEKLEAIAKLEALKVNLNSNELKQVEEVKRLKNDNQELFKTVNETKTGIKV